MIITPEYDGGLGMCRASTWDDIGTVHNAVADDMPTEPRYMRRAQVMATLDYQHLLAG
jgi:hypothetical protein